jgi:hypothetical protein
LLRACHFKPDWFMLLSSPVVGTYISQGQAAPILYKTPSINDHSINENVVSNQWHLSGCRYAMDHWNCTELRAGLVKAKKNGGVIHWVPQWRSQVATVKSKMFVFCF